MKLSIESPCIWFFTPFPRHHCVTVFVISNRFGTTLCILSNLYLYLFPTGSVLRGALLAGRLVGPLPDGQKHEQAILCRVPLCPRQVSLKIIYSSINILSNVMMIVFLSSGKWIHTKRETQKVGKKDNTNTNTKRMNTKYDTNTISSKGKETHKTMLEEGGGSEKAFTGICGQMVCEKISMVSILVVGLKRNLGGF